MYEYTSKAIEIMNQAGFYPTSFEADGRIHRFKVSPNERKKNGWYVGHLKKNRLYIVFGDWKRGTSPYQHVIYDSHILGSFGNAAIKEFEDEFKEIQALRKKEDSIRNETASIEAVRLWNQASLYDVAKHPYLEKKRLKRGYGARILGNLLLIPVRDIHEKLWGLQKISALGNKMFLSGQKKKACFFRIGEVIEGYPIFICEGFATGASLYELTSMAVFVAFDAGNLKSVAKVLRQKYQTETFVFAADNDESLVGLNSAVKAAESITGRSHIIIPDYKDFNDMHIALGPDAAREQIMNTIDTFFKGAELWRSKL